MDLLLVLFLYCLIASFVTFLAAERLEPAWRRSEVLRHSHLTTEKATLRLTILEKGQVTEGTMFRERKPLSTDEPPKHFKELANRHLTFRCVCFGVSVVGAIGLIAEIIGFQLENALISIESKICNAKLMPSFPGELPWHITCTWLPSPFLGPGLEYMWTIM